MAPRALRRVRRQGVGYRHCRSYDVATLTSRRHIENRMGRSVRAGVWLRRCNTPHGWISLRLRMGNGAGKTLRCIRLLESICVGTFKCQTITSSRATRLVRRDVFGIPKARVRADPRRNRYFDEGVFELANRYWTRLGAVSPGLPPLRIIRSLEPVRASASIC